MKRIVFAIIATLLAVGSADAATCYWVGGTGTYSTTSSAHWASASGGTGGTCAATGGVPKQATDTAILDGSSGGGTVTIDSSMSGTTFDTFNASAFAGTVTFTGTGSITLANQIVLSGTPVAVNLNNWTFNLTQPGNYNYALDCSSCGANINAGTSTINVTSAGTTSGNRGINVGAATWSTITIGSTPANYYIMTFANGGSMTIGTLNIGAKNIVNFTGYGIMTITNPISWGGASSSAGGLAVYGLGFQLTLAVAAGSTCNWCSIGGLTFTGSPVANNSTVLGNNSGITISAPSGGGGNKIIGG